MKNKNQYYLVMILLALSNDLLAQNFTGGFNFYLPPKDTVQSAYLPSFPAKAITDQDFVSIDANGHFTVHGNPIRFFGTNFGANTFSTAKNDIWFVAGRLRKMGFNLVRIFTMTGRLVAFPSLFKPGSNELNMVTVDNLENMIEEFKKNGIYIDLNLIGGTDLNVEIANKDSIPLFVNYFDPQILSLNKKFAKQLLTHINPYTGKPLWDDPVMASLEITNENSLYNAWHNNRLKAYFDGGSLPCRYEKMLDSLWIAYLKSKYLSTDSLKSAWNIGLNTGKNIEKVMNGGFETPVSSDWKIDNWGTGSAIMTNDSINAFQGNYSGRVIVAKADGIDWHLSLVQTGLSVINDSVYQFTFAAQADSIQTITVAVSKSSSPFTTIGYCNPTLTPQWKTFSFSFKPSETLEKDVHFSFNVGASKGSYWFDNVSFGGMITKGLLAGESFESNTIRRIDYSECKGFSDQRVKDMSAFYLQLEENYFSSIRSFLKDSIGVKIPIVGNTLNNGVADCAGMSLMDYVDNHSYWDHPTFPSDPWSTSDWHINNSAMVNSEGGTITGLMGGTPILNKPYTISEYNHIFPNLYQTEGMLFIASYASFHDADAFMLFTYNGGHNVDYNETLDWVTDWNASFFGVDRNTAMMSLVPSCAMAYRNGLVDKYKQLVKVQYHPDSYLLYPKIDFALWGAFSPYNQKLSLEHGLRTVSYFADSTTDFSSLPAVPVSPYITDTKQLVWDTTGLFTVSSPAFNAATGFLNLFSNQTFGSMSLVSGSDFGTLTWISLDGDKLPCARKSLMTVSSRVENTNMVWDGIHTLHTDWGVGSTKMQPLIVQMKLNVLADSIVVHPLDMYGNPGSSSQTYYPSSAHLFAVTIDQNKDQSVWFGIDAYGDGNAPVDNLPYKKDDNFIQNYPNPFNTSTTFSFELTKSSFVSLKVFDLTGREVGTIVSEKLTTGNYTRNWYATYLKSGIYFYRFEAGNYIQIKKFILLR